MVPPWLLSAFAPYAKAILTGSLRVSTAKAKQELGWAPQYEDLDTIIAHAWQWERRLQQVLQAA